MNVNVDLIGNGKAQGDLAKFLQTNGSINPGRMRPFVAENGKAYISVFKGKKGQEKNPAMYQVIQVNEGTLRREEWQMLDAALVEVAHERLTGFDYIVNKGLTWSLPNAMGTTVIEWQSISDSQEAIMTMDGVVRGQGDRVQYKSNYLPIPILSVDYEINSRALSVSRRMGNGLDTEEAKNAARRIREKKEDLLFGNPAVPYSFGGGTIYSFLNFPERTPVTLTTSWADPTMTGEAIVADVMAMKAAAIADKHYGPWTLFIPTNYELKLDEDYQVSGGKVISIRDRVLMISGIDEIVTVDRLATDNVLLVQMSSDTVQIVNGLPMQNIQWKTEGDFVNKYKVIEIAVPRLRADYYGKSGVVHLA